MGFEELHGWKGRDYDAVRVTFNDEGITEERYSETMLEVIQMVLNAAELDEEEPEDTRRLRRRAAS